MTAIAIAKGNGIGPEIMDATLEILKAAGASLKIHEVEVGEKIYQQGILSGIEESTWETLYSTKAFLKAPVTTPQGGGFKSINVTVRSALGLYANIRPCTSYYPYIATKHPKMDLVIIRENEEDLYIGVEYRQTEHVFHAQKLISTLGCQKIIRYAFEYALANQRKRVTCMTKDNILKLSDGAFHRVFDEISKEYPTIGSNHWIIDIGAAKIANAPDEFDVIVAPNLYGDILSDIAAEIAGSVGLVGTANIGEKGAMFEAIHGSAPKLAGRDVANPSALLLSAIQMLIYLEQDEIAMRIYNAWATTIEEGIHTYDIYNPNTSKEQVGTKAFATAVIQRLGKKPTHLKPASFSSIHHFSEKPIEDKTKRKLVGCDITIQCKARPDDKLQKIAIDDLQLVSIFNRGTRVWPKLQGKANMIEEWRCRFLSSSGCQNEDIIYLLQLINKNGFEFLKTENLYDFDDKTGFTT